jgi:hypothetical protein
MELFQLQLEMVALVDLLPLLAVLVVQQLFVL